VRVVFLEGRVARRAVAAAELRLVEMFAVALGLPRELQCAEFDWEIRRSLAQVALARVYVVSIIGRRQSPAVHSR
jgi:hypothetical protein